MLTNFRSIINKSQPVFLVLALTFITFFIKNNWNVISTINWTINWFYLSLSFLFTFPIFFFLIKRLQIIFNSNQISISFLDLLKIISRTTIIRYVPGGIWNHISSLALIQSRLKNKYSAKTIGKIISISIFFEIFSGLIFVIFLIPSYILSILIMLIYFMLIFNLNYFSQIFNNLWKKNIRSQNMIIPFFKKKDVFRILILSWVGWICIGISFFLFLKTFNLIDYSYENVFVTVNAYVVSWIAGFLVLPLPSGAGVREFVLGYILADTLKFTTVVITLSLLFRLLILIRDVVFFLFSLYWKDIR